MANKTLTSIQSLLRALVICCALTSVARPQANQEPATDESAIEERLNESNSTSVETELARGIYYYRSGATDARQYEQAIRTLDEVILNLDPANATAYLFRALSHGRIALLQSENRIREESKADVLREVLAIGADPDALAAFEQVRLEERQRLDQAHQDAEREGVEVNVFVLSEAIDRFENESQDIDSFRQLEDAELREELDAVLTVAKSSAEKEQQHFIAMIQDVKEVIKLLPDAPAVIDLLDVISQAKVARRHEHDALLFLETAQVNQPAESKNTIDAAAFPKVLELRRQSADILADVAQTLETLNNEELVGQDAVRTRFFLGVIRFRQAVTMRAENERRDPKDINTQHLAQAEELMRSFRDDPSADVNWKSFGALYMGLILPIKATLSRDADERDRLIDASREWLYDAAQLDMVSSDDGYDSRSGGAIPDIVHRQRTFIDEKLLTAEPVTSSLVNDFKMTLQFGTHRDTNVVLLGERTDLPRNVTDENDFAFSLDALFDYTVNLGVLDPDLDKWTFGFRGLVSTLWHNDVGEFDEQNYGASAAAQYELAPAGETDGPVYFQLQYDYEFTLLGRQRFLESAALTPRIRAFLDDRNKTIDFYVRYDIRDYHEPLFDKRFNRDGVYVSVGVIQTEKWWNMTPVYENMGLPAWGRDSDTALQQDDFDFPNRYVTPFIGLEYGWDATDGDEFDVRSFALSFGAGVPLPYGVSLNSQFSFTWDDYNAEGSLVDFHRRRRRDFTQRYSLALSRTFVLLEGAQANRATLEMDHVLMTLRAHATWTLNDSNVVDRFGQSIFEYDRAVYGLSVAFSFN